MRIINPLLLIFIIMLLAGCASRPSSTRPFQDGAPNYNIDVNKIANAVPKKEPLSRYGNPKTYTVNGKTYRVMTSSQGHKERGIASWYGIKFHGQYTSSREPYNMAAMTAAHKTLPLPTYLRVTNLTNQRQVIVKVNDRGPFVGNRIIDLSYAAAKKLDIIGNGTGLVEIEAINFDQSEMSATHARLPTPKRYMAKPNSLYTQAGTFSNQLNANQLAACIKQLTTHPVQIKPNQSTGKTLYRVMIGPLASMAESESLQAKLRSANLGNAITVFQ